MKKFTLLLALMVAFAVTGIQAQSHSDKEAKACAKTCSKAADANAKDAKSAAKLASRDDSIEQKVSEESGEVTYVRKTVGDDGAAQLIPVTYSASTKEFVADTKSDKACCSSGSAKATTGCCSKKGTKVAGTGSAAPAKTKDTKKADS